LGGRVAVGGDLVEGDKKCVFFVDTFTRRDWQVADYLLSKVLNRQTQETREFLLQTSIGKNLLVYCMSLFLTLIISIILASGLHPFTDELGSSVFSGKYAEF